MAALIGDPSQMQRAFVLAHEFTAGGVWDGQLAISWAFAPSVRRVRGSNTVASRRLAFVVPVAFCRWVKRPFFWSCCCVF